MGMYDHLTNFFKVLSSDETLLRLLAYQPSNANDNPLSEEKTNIIGTPLHPKIVSQRVLRVHKSTDLPQSSICRVCVYLGENIGGSKQQSNKVFRQEIILDVYAHIDDYEMKDNRCLKICDRLNELLHEEYITGLGKTFALQTYPIPNAPDGYIGYKMVFRFGSTK